MAPRPRYLHRPVKFECDGEIYRFYTIGHLAEAAGRTTRTVRNWQALGLLPKPPFALNPTRRAAKRGLYPEELVETLRRLSDSGTVGRRLDGIAWDMFSDEVWTTFEWAMEPFRGATAFLVTNERE